jgi:hypothetical protein
MSGRPVPRAVWVLLGVFGVFLLSCGAGVAWLASSEQGRRFLDAARQ